MPLRSLCSILIALPWLWSLTAGPSAATVPYLAAIGIGALLLALWPATQKEDGAVIIASGWLVAALASSVIALLQYFNLETAFYPWVNIAQPGQAFGNLRQPNQLASLLVIGLLAVRWLVQRERLAAPYASLMGVLMLTALAATASRVGLVELLVMGAITLWWARGLPNPLQRLAVTAAALVIYMAAALILPVLIENTQGIAGRDVIERLRTAESTCGSRINLWSNVLHLISLKPWLGWGWGELDYAHYITLYDGPRFCHILDNAHNLPLHLAVELGVPVALIACALVAWLLWRNKPWAEQDPARQLAWGVLAAIGIHSMVEYPLWYGPFQIAVLLSIWLLWRPSTSGGMGIPLPMRQVVAASLLAGVAYAGWDYHRISQLYLPYEERSRLYRFDARAHAQRSWLFSDVVRFAEVTTTPVTRENAERLLSDSLAALHFSPESRTAIKVIESASLLGKDDLALAHMARFRAAFPVEYREWAESLHQSNKPVM